MRNIFVAVVSAIALSVTAQAQTKKTVPAAPPARKMVTPAYQAPATVQTTSWVGHSSFQNEVDVNLSGGYLYSYKRNSKSYTDLNVYGTYSYDLGQNNVQVGADVGLQTFDSSTYLTLVATGTYNIDPNYADSIFFKGGLGLFPVLKDGDVKNEFGLYVGAGKRFKIWDHVNYKPMLMIAKISDLDAEFRLLFLNISVNWN